MDYFLSIVEFVFPLNPFLLLMLRLVASAHKDFALFHIFHFVHLQKQKTKDKAGRVIFFSLFLVFNC